MARPPSAMTVTNIVTVENREEAEAAPSSSRSRQPETLTLRLNRKKKQVTWKEGTVDNEFMQKKSSKKCCIFHKQKPFDEDDSDCEDDHERHRDHGHGGDKGCCSKSHD